MESFTKNGMQVEEQFLCDGVTFLLLTLLPYLETCPAIYYNFGSSLRCMSPVVYYLGPSYLRCALYRPLWESLVQVRFSRQSAGTPFCVLRRSILSPFISYMYLPQS